MHTSPKTYQSEALRTGRNVHSQLKPDDDDASEIQIIEEEEEVLVDDFDGQCCRTYPFNHSKIQRWQEERKRKEKEKQKKEEEDVKPLPLVQSVKTTASSDKPLARASNTITNSSSKT